MTSRVIHGLRVVATRKDIRKHCHAQWIMCVIEKRGDWSDASSHAYCKYRDIVKRGLG